ncbi:unnamed protein product, partial [Brenthis ino]
MVLSEPVTVASPSTTGQTSNLCTSQIPETGSLSVKMDLNTGPPLTGLDSPVARPRIYRPRRLNSPYKSKTTVQSKIDPEWVKGLENRRLDAETKLAEAALFMAESTRTQAEAAKVQADTMRSLVELPPCGGHNVVLCVPIDISNALLELQCSTPLYFWYDSEHLGSALLHYQVLHLQLELKAMASVDSQNHL